MKTRRVATSACLSALLAVSMTPLRSYAAVGTPMHPLAAQQAFQSAANGFGAAGWAVPSPSEFSSVPTPVPAKTAPSAPQPKAAPTTEEWIARLVKFSRSYAPDKKLANVICKSINVCDGTEDLSIHLAEAETATDGAIHYFALPADPESKDIIIVRKFPVSGAVEVFLTDKTGKLRIAAASDKNRDLHLVPNEKAMEQYKKEMALFAAEAAGLPPTGTAVAGTN